MKVAIGPYKNKRKIKIKIDKYDIWNMDHTLALIILPMLKQLKETKHGSPFVDDSDVPDELKTLPTENKWDTDDNFHKRWEWVVDELIWTFEKHLEDDYMNYKENEPRLSRGFTLFGKYFRALWT